MVDSPIKGPEASNLRAQFGAAFPRQDVNRAESFLQALDTAGAAPTTQQVHDGQKILADLGASAELFAFQMAMQAGGATSTADMDTQLAAVEQALGRIETTTDALRARLTS